MDSIGIGFHPLWMGIVAIVFRLQADPQRAVQIVIGLCALLTVVSGLLLVAVLQRAFASAGAALAGTLVYFFNAHWLSESINGLESALAMLTLVLVLLTFAGLLCPGSGTATPMRRAVLLGLALGLASLARTDLAVFLPLAVGIGLLVNRRCWRHWLWLA
jgi:hypothetical protein